jgi:thioredoxin 1
LLQKNKNCHTLRDTLANRQKYYITERITMAMSITKKTYEEEIIDKKKSAIIDVFAPWCGPCQHMKPIFAQLEQELGNNYLFATLNVEDDRELSMSLGISSIPTFIFIKDGIVTGKEVGMMSVDQMRAKIQEYCE